MTTTAQLEAGFGLTGREAVLLSFVERTAADGGRSGS
jgi:hypothetical protein